MVSNANSYDAKKKPTIGIMKKKAISTVVAIFVAQFRQLKKRNYAKKRYWISPLFAIRDQAGFFARIFPTLSTCDNEFRNYMRMTLDKFEDLLYKVGPIITKKHVIRDPIPAAARLALTLRFVIVYFCFHLEQCKIYFVITDF